MFKRHAGFLRQAYFAAGHGGIIDRIDSITGAAPVFALGMMWDGSLSLSFANGSIGVAVLGLRELGVSSRLLARHQDHSKWLP